MQYTINPAKMPLCAIPHGMTPHPGRHPLPEIRSLVTAMHVAVLAGQKRPYKEWSRKYQVKITTIRVLMSRYRSLRDAVSYEERTINRVVGDHIQNAIGKRTIEQAGLAGCGLMLRVNPQTKEIVIGSDDKCHYGVINV